jgi:hypothetical protein
MADSSPTVASVFTDHQLEDWAAEPADAENVKRDALKRVDDALAPLRGSYADLELFVQGGYANRTAVSAQSDVDIIVRWPGVFVGDSADDASAASSYRQFRDDVLDTLRSRLDKGIPAALKPDVEAWRRRAPGLGPWK